MMAINIEIISRELIKPSSPTPPHLKNLKLSFLDQTAPPYYVPIILFYQSEFPSNVENANKYSRSLKQTLSQNLTRFYSLAGRLNHDGASIECNDAGVEYVEARVEAQISQVIDNPNMEELTKFQPINPYDSMNNVVLLAIQINFFACGGLAIVVCVSHRVADGSSLVSFINSWASQSLGKAQIPNPNICLAHKLFPPIDLSVSKPTLGIAQEPVVTKRFVFDKIKLAKLKQEMTTTSISPTRVEAVSAFIWKKLINASKAKNTNTDEEKSYVAVHAVNLRPKTSPPLGDVAFGNIWCYVKAVSLGDEQVGQLRDAIKKIDRDYVKSLEDYGERYMDYVKKLTNDVISNGGGKFEFLSFSSWCRFPFYDVDYGWGKPVWVCTTTQFKNFVVLMSTRDGDGIEAWVSIVEADMAVLEAAYKLL